MEGLKIKLKKFVALIVTLVFSLGILTEFVVISKPQPVFGAMSVNVVNFGLLINLLRNLLLELIVNYFDKSIKDLGALYDFSVSGLNKNIEELYNQFYLDAWNEVFSLSQSHTNWYQKVIKDTGSVHVPPLISLDGGGVEKQQVVNFAHYLQGDLAYLKKLYDSIRNNKEIDELTKEIYLIQIKNLESGKVSLSQEVIELASTAKKISKLKEELKRHYQSLDSRMASTDYTSYQAVKDLLKVEMINSLLLLEVLRTQMNVEMMYSAFLNEELNKKREALVDKLVTKTARVESR